MVAINQTITIINQSGKIVRSSKHLVSVFNEAKSAYNERKAELKALRKNQLDSGDGERKIREQLDTFTLSDGRSRDDASTTRSSRRGSEHGRSVKRKEHRTNRPPIDRGTSDTFYANDLPPQTDRRHSSFRPSPLRRSSMGIDDDEPRVGELARRHTSGFEMQSSRRSRRTRRRSLDDIDMDLAYGELPPLLPERKYHDEVELRQKVSGLQTLLDECNCLQHSVSAIVDSLQKNPEALAAVALTLGEISNLVTKMAPGALATIKGSFPAVVALLASPEFAIAAGVGVGVTIIAFGGYKIVKKLKAKREEERALALDGPPCATVADPTQQSQPIQAEEEMDDLRELSSIEFWRRGVADVEASSLGTSVEGEFITPQATRTLLDEGRLTEADFKKVEDGSERGKERRRRKKRTGSSTTSSASSKVTASERGSGRSRVASAKTRPKEKSGLRLLFKR